MSNPTVIPGPAAEGLTRAQMIAAANDEFRRTNEERIFFGGAIIEAVNPLDKLVILSMVRQFSSFTQENDPYGEHDFLSFNYGPHKIMAKMDYLNETLTDGMDPLDPACCRVLTIFLAEDY